MKTSTAEILAGTPPPNLRTCQDCGQDFELPPFALAATLIRSCPECSEEAIEAHRLRMIAAAPRRDVWQEIVPKAFWDTEPHKLPSPTKLQKTMEWQFGPRGLILHGATRRGKTRCAWELVKREVKAGRKVAVLNCQFAFEYAASYADSPLDALEWVRRYQKAELLFLDDVLKAKLTEGVEQALFAIVNHRLEHCIPMIVTTNDTGESLIARMTGDRGGPLIARLRECCNSISF